MSKTREEEYALKNNKGILIHSASHMMSLDEISFSFMNGFNALIESQEQGSENRAMLGYCKSRMEMCGILMPPISESEHKFPLLKDEMLTLCGQLQMYSEKPSYDAHRRGLFWIAASTLRKYLYANYELSALKSKRNKNKRNPQPPVETVENVPKP